ncbi:hypothetical protein BB559_006809 [Furculomyces boomerangus]|uniref:Uncharacterized protein n=2 Tax=Harpellales TaxID=61421 RepID=A0A2T9Y0F0_9FUNG|nr:hypothetical protein BB559_006809 [Furculomyces boomerangus]PWA01280.1 hypothetical protein BB558_002632 [Smittium angustum]
MKENLNYPDIFPSPDSSATINNQYSFLSSVNGNVSNPHPNLYSFPSSTLSSTNHLLKPRRKKLTAHYWNVNPGKFVLEAFDKNTKQLYCDPKTKLIPAYYTIEGNGNKANAHGCFKCSVCKRKIRDTEFYVKVLGGNADDIPESIPVNLTTSFSNNQPMPNITSFQQDFSTNTANGFPPNSPASSDSFDFNNSYFSNFKNPKLVSEPEFGVDFLNKLDSIQENRNEVQLNPIPRKRYAEDPDSSDITKDFYINQMDTFMLNVLKLVDQKIANINLEKNLQSAESNSNIKIKRNTNIDSESTLALKNENTFLKRQISDLNMKFDKLVKLSSKSTKAHQKYLNNQVSNDQSANLDKTYNNMGVLRYSKKPNFVEIAKNRLKGGNNDDINKFSGAMRLLAGVKPLGTGTKSEKKHKVARIFVQGITRQPIHQVKKSLATLKFRLTKILHMDFIGKSTMEYTLMEDYARSFVTHTKAFQFMTVMPKIDPSKPMDLMATKETKEIIMQAFQRRINNAIQNTTKSSVRDYFIDLADEHELVVDPIINEDSIPEYIEECDQVDMEEISMF